MFKNPLIVASLLTALSFSPANASLPIDVWKEQVKTQIQEKHFYPRSAINKGLEGTLKLRLTISQNGLVKGARIVETSGSAILDKNALKLASRLNKLPTVPTTKDEASFIIPLTYQITPAS